jgi:hypothetical protein
MSATPCTRGFDYDDSLARRQLKKWATMATFTSKGRRAQKRISPPLPPNTEVVPLTKAEQKNKCKRPQKIAPVDFQMI